MQKNKFIEEITADGSPTLRLNQEGSSESMHNASGAASETVFIYGEALLEAQKLIPYDQTNYFVFGLGLGYIEILIALLTHFKFKHIDSFEKEPELIQNFQKWLKLEETVIYDKVFSHLQQKIGMSVKKEQVKKLLSERLHVHPQVDFKTTSEKKYQVICYDAFSKKTDEPLWSNEYLNEFIKKYADQTCVFATYAKTGDLSRVLKDHGFHIIERPGFAGKRDSTLAMRS